MAQNKTTKVLSNRLEELTEGKRDIDYRLSDKKQAEQMGIPYPTFVKYKRDKAECPISTIVKMAEYYGVSTDYLLGLQKKPSNTPNVIAVTEYTELSPEATEKLHNIGLRNKATANSDTLSELIENEDFEYFLALLAAKMCEDNNSNKQVETGNARINIKVSALTEYEIGRIISEISTQMKDNYQKKYDTVDERQERIFRRKMYGFADGLYKENRITEEEYKKVIAEYDKGNFEYGIGRKV